MHDFEWAVQLNRFSLKLIGLWPQEYVDSREKLKSDFRLFTIVIMITCFLTIPSLHSLIKIWSDMMAIVDNLMYTCPFLVVSIKMLIMWWKKEKLSPLVTMIAHDWEKSKSSKERNVMIHRAQNARLIILFSYVLTIATLTILIVLSGFGYNLRYATNITHTNRLLPFQAYYIYNTSASPQYEITFFIQCIISIICMLPFTGIDNFLGLLLFHICGQLENLTSRLYKMRDSNNFEAALKINVKDHVRLVRSVAIIEDTFTLMLLLIVLYFCILTSIYGFLFVTIIFEDKNISIKRVIFLNIVICTVIAHMCVYCMLGEFLVIKYEKVYRAIYECEWYMLKTKEAKNLILLMIRTNKPLYITAGKLLPMTMSTLCNILKTSAGYISVLLAKRN